MQMRGTFQGDLPCGRREPSQDAYHGNDSCGSPSICNWDPRQDWRGPFVPTRVQGRTTFSRIDPLEGSEISPEVRGKEGRLGIESGDRDCGRAGRAKEKEARPGARACRKEEKRGEREGRPALPFEAAEKEADREEKEGSRVPQWEQLQRGEIEEGQGEAKIRRQENRPQKFRGSVWGDRARSPQSHQKQGDALCQAQDKKEVKHFVVQWGNVEQWRREEQRGGWGPSHGREQNPMSSSFWAGRPHGHGGVSDEGDGHRAGGALERRRPLSTSCGDEVHQEYSSGQDERWCPERDNDVRDYHRLVDDGPRQRSSRCRHATTEIPREDFSGKLLDFDREIGAGGIPESSYLHERGDDSSGQGGEAGPECQGVGLTVQGQRLLSRKQRKERQGRRERKEQERRRRRQRSPGQEGQVKKKRRADETERRKGETGSRGDEDKCLRGVGSALGCIKSPPRGEGELNLPAAFCPAVGGAATSSTANFVQASDFCPRKENEEVRFSTKGGFPEVVSWLNSRLEYFVFERCRTQPTGRVFPLPTSDLMLKAAFPTDSHACVSCLRLLIFSLNSLNGEGLVFDGTVSPFQRKVLGFLMENCRRVATWEVDRLPADWDAFFNAKSVDYKGEEVLMAQPIQWENISPALPTEVGSVDLAQVVEHGCLHYVNNFTDYLLPEADQIYTRPPKVHVPVDEWDRVCEGLLRLGVCQVIAESDVHQVQGQPLLNGLFGVSKHEFCQGYEVRRLIMNLIPLNRICRGLSGDVATLPSWANMSALHLAPHEDMVVSSEDVRCFFYIFRVPAEWHPFLAFNRVISPRFCQGRVGKHYLCSAVLPMGFKNSVSLAQQIHRVIVRRCLEARNLGIGGEAEIRKDRPFPSGGHMYRVYLDNFDELKKVNKVLAEAIEGRVSPLTLGLREEYLHQSIPRHPKKSVQQQRVADVQGAIVDGCQGVAYPKPEKVVKYCQLACHLLHCGRCTQRQAQVVGGGFVYLAMFRRPLLGSLNALWRFIASFEGYPPIVKRDIPADVKEELCRFIGLSPLAVMSFRSALSPCVTASDASEYGEE